MSGITGIVLKDKHPEPIRLIKSLDCMSQAMVYNPAQVSRKYTDDHIFVANAIPISSKKNDHFVQEKSLPYVIILDGLVYIDDNEKKILIKKYKTTTFYNDYQYLPFLYDHYQLEFLLHLTGWFNIFIYNKQTHESTLANDRLGYLPLYVYESKEYFLFASKIEALLASGLLKDISFDEVTLAEHLFFHYSLSDHTYIKDIRTLPDASCLTIHSGGITNIRYWQLEELFGIHSLGKKESIEAIDDALQFAVNKPFERTSNRISFSLTGGWDSRLLLSYMIPYRKSVINSYSFGTPGSDDIRIPELIAAQEGFQYTPYLLNQEYLDKCFLSYAKDTIRLSNSTRNYKRTHYLYAIKNVGEISDTLITGIYGDEVLKVGKPQGNAVISQNSVKLIESDFNEGSILKLFKASAIPSLFHNPANLLYDQLGQRLVLLKERFGGYETSGQRYFSFRLLLNLRKFFGNEVNSYNDFVYSHSPFIDYDFLKAFAGTKYMVSRFDFKDPSIKLKAQSSLLYYKLTQRHNPSLTHYPSSRGFSMKDSWSLMGIPKALYVKLLKKKFKRPVDGFNTKATDQMFYLFLEQEQLLNKNLVFRRQPFIPGLQDFFSLIYWTSIISSKYIK